MPHKSSSDSPVDLGFDEMMKVNAHNIEALAKSCGSLFETVGKVNEQAVNFCVERWKEDLDMPTRIAQCQAPEEVGEAYARFMSKMVNDYSEQAHRVMDLVGGVAKESFPMAYNGQPQDSATSQAK